MLRNLIVLPDGTEIFSGNPRGNAVASAEYKQKVNSGTELTIGSVCASCLSMKLIAAGGNLSISAGTEFSYYKVADDGTRTKIGLFTMEKPTRSGANSYEIEAYDRVSWLDKDLTEWLAALDGWPYTVSTFARMVCEACGLTLAAAPTVNAGYEIREFSGSGVTGRTLMQWLGQITCRFIRANSDGKIEFAWYADRGTEITTNGDLCFFGGSLSYEDFQVAEIQKVQIQSSDEDNGTVYPDGNEEELNTYKITGNYLLTAETGDELKPVAQAIFEQLQGVTYTPCKVSIQATTGINAGDIVHITDRNGVTITTYVMSKTNSGQKDTLECTGSYARDSSTATNEVTLKALNGKVLNISKSVDGLRVEAKDTAGKVANLELSTKEITASVEDVKKTSDDALKEAQQNAKDLNDYAEQVTGSLTDLQNQIDGAIETWFYSYVPTASNAPASSWTTTEDKNKHLGDLFYIVDNDEKGGQVYRWALVNGVYGWVLVEDTEVAKALETASKAKDTADSKRRVFISQPTPPYDVGDLWTNGTDLYRCNNARQTGSYTASDWGLATEYITETATKALIKVAQDSIALSVKSVETKVTDAQSAAESASSTANAAQSTANSAASAAANAQKTADGISVGGRNLISGTSSDKEYSGNKGTASYKDVWTGTTIDPATGSEYVVSFDAKADESMTITCFFYSPNTTKSAKSSTGQTGTGSDGSCSVTIGTEWKRYWVKWTQSATTAVKRVIVGRNFSASNIYIRAVKLEEGNIATDWTVAPEDIEEQLETIVTEMTELKVTAKGVDMVSEDSSGKLVSFIGNGENGGEWSAKYYQNNEVVSGLYFDLSSKRFNFDGDIHITSKDVARPNYTNQITKATDTDGSIYGGVGFKEGYGPDDNYNIVSGSKYSGYATTGFIPCKVGDIIRLDGLTVNKSDSTTQFIFYNASKAFLGSFVGGSTYALITEWGSTVDANGNYTKVPVGSITLANGHTTIGAAFVRVVASGVTTGSVVTINEEITGETIVGTLETKITGDGYWESTYTKNGAITSGLYFDFYSSQFKFVGQIVGGSININDNFLVDQYGNVALNGSITWGTGTSPTQVLYASSALTKPTNGTSWSSFPASGTGWHQSFLSSDYYASYTYDGGATWTDAVQVRGINGANGSSASVTSQAVFNALTNNGQLFGCFANSGANELYINASYIRAGMLESSVIRLPYSYTTSDLDTGMALDGMHLSLKLSGAGAYLYSAGLAYAYGSTTVLNYGLSSSGFQLYNNGTLQGTMSIGNTGSKISTATMSSSSYAYLSGVWCTDGMYFGTSASAARLYLTDSLLKFKYSSTDVGTISTYSSYVNITGTWKTNGSAWISSSDARLKNTIEDFADAHDILFDNLRPRTFKWNDGTSDRTHSGFIVQEVVEAVETAGLTTQDFAAVVNFKDENGEDDGWGLRYEEIISLNTWQIQKLKARVAELERKLYAVN